MKKIKLEFYISDDEYEDLVKYINKITIKNTEKTFNFTNIPVVYKTNTPNVIALEVDKDLSDFEFDIHYNDYYPHEDKLSLEGYNPITKENVTILDSSDLEEIYNIDMNDLTILNEVDTLDNIIEIKDKKFLLLKHEK